MNADDLWNLDLNWTSAMAGTLRMDTVIGTRPPRGRRVVSLPDQDQFAPDGGERFGLFSQQLTHSDLSSVMGFFRQIIHMDPTRKALISHRELFPFTGEVTREQRRKKDLMTATFETHRAQILKELQNPSVLVKVTSILLNSNKRIPDREVMQFYAAKFYHSL
jgi:hypothetical protein